MLEEGSKYYMNLYSDRHVSCPWWSAGQPYIGNISTNNIFRQKKHATIQRKGLRAESEICKVSNTLKMGQIITVEFYKLCAYIKKLLSSNTNFALEYGRLSTEQRFWVKSHLPKNTLMAKKVVASRDDVSFLWLFLFHQSARSKDRLFGVI